MSFRVKKGDKVVIIAGKEKGETGKVLAVNPTDNYVKVENRNMVTRHRKARSAQDVGGRIQQEGNIHISNVQVICPTCNVPTRIKAGLDDNNKKIRVCMHCGAALDVKEEKAKKTAKKSAKSGETKAKRTRKSSKTEAADNAANN